MSIDTLIGSIWSFLTLQVKVRHGGQLSVLVILLVLSARYLFARSAKENTSRKERIKKHVIDDLTSKKILRATALIEVPQKADRKVYGEIAQPLPGSYRLIIEDSQEEAGAPKVNEFLDMLALEKHLEKFTPLRLGDFK